MKRSKIWIVALILAIMSATSLATARPAKADNYSWAMTAAKALLTKGILKGNGSGDLMLGQTVTRAQFAAFIARALNLQVQKVDVPFVDVSTQDPLYNAIYETAASGIVTGYPDGTFKPDQNITRQEMAVMISRMLQYRGIVSGSKAIYFKDKSKINSNYLTAIQNCVYWGIIQGDPVGTFRPTDNSKRADAIEVIYRAMNVTKLPTPTKPTTPTNPTSPTQPQTSDYVIASIQNGSLTQSKTKTFSQFSDAVAAAKASPGDVVVKNNKVVWMSSGTVYANTMVDFGDTYVVGGTELRYGGSDGSLVTISLAGNSDTVPISQVNLIPKQLETGHSYYQVSGSELDHYIFQPLSNRYVSYEFGAAPSFMQPGQKYFSWDGSTFYSNEYGSGTPVGTAYQYFDILPLKSTTSYTADQLNQFVINNVPDSVKAQFKGGPGPLATLGQAFVAAQNKYGVNAMYLLAHAILESDWGASAIAQQKFNLFGVNANDTNPLGDASTYASFAQCVDKVAQFVTTDYQTPGNFQYFGDLLGDKNIGMNMKYASDPYWGQKIAGLMYQIDSYLGRKEINKYKIVLSSVGGNNIRSTPTTNPVGASNILYQLPPNHAGASEILLNTVHNSEGTWFQIMSDLATPSNTAPAYVYSVGPTSNGQTFDAVAQTAGPTNLTAGVLPTNGGSPTGTTQGGTSGTGTTGSGTTGSTPASSTPAKTSSSPTSTSTTGTSG